MGEKSAPTSIEAVHGSLKTVSVWKRDAKKKLRFSIQAKGRGAEVLLKISPGSLMYADDVGTMKKEIFINWGTLAEEIWGYVEGKLGITVVSEFLKSRSNLAEANIVLGKRMILIGAVILVIGIAVFGVSIVLLDFNSVGLAVLPIIGIINMFWGAVKLRWGR